jgi:hypothetical protein
MEEKRKRYVFSDTVDNFVYDYREIQIMNEIEKRHIVRTYYNIAQDNLKLKPEAFEDKHMINFANINFGVNQLFS